MAFASSVSNLPFVADELVPAEEASSDCNREGFSTALFLEFSSLNICEESLRSGLLKIKTSTVNHGRGCDPKSNVAPYLKATARTYGQILS